MTLPAQRAAELGQSIWYDNISRDLLESGEVARLVSACGVRGITSNPSIFEKAMSKSPAYAGQFAELAAQGLDAKAIYEALAVTDIRAGADALAEVHRVSGGTDGFVSLEVSPALANDTAGTVAEAKRLWAAVDRPNLMIKIPATPAGMPAIREVIAAGLNVNVTLIFSLEAYGRVMDAYMAGLEDRVAAGEPVSGIASVASFFVSRLDSAVDARLEAHGAAGMALMGRAAVANAKLAYAAFEERVATPRWKALAARGAHVQRPLWASTSTKNPEYRDTLYVDTLIGPHTVNTLPPATLVAFNDHGRAEVTVRSGMDRARADVAAIEALGIRIDTVCAELLDQGVASFAKSFDDLLAAVEGRRRSVPVA